MLTPQRHTLTIRKPRKLTTTDTVSVWIYGNLLGKSVMYLAMLAVGGALFVSWLQYSRSKNFSPINNRFLLISTCLGILAACVFFLLQIGQINQQGLVGMLDMQMGLILAESTLGSGLQWRLAGFMLAALAGLFFLVSGAVPGLINPGFVLGAIGCCLFAWSFAILGHVNVHGIDMQIAAALHFLAVSVWVGALYPLAQLCHVSDLTNNPINDPTNNPTHDQTHDRNREELTAVMTSFGRAGWWFIGVMVVSGLWMAWQLTGSWNALTDTVHGRFLLLKLCLVACLLGLGMLNKFRWVARLRSGIAYDATVMALRRTIYLEMGVAVLIVLAVALLTTISGPQV